MFRSICGVFRGVSFACMIAGLCCTTANAQEPGANGNDNPITGFRPFTPPPATAPLIHGGPDIPIGALAQPQTPTVRTPAMQAPALKTPRPRNTIQQPVSPVQFSDYQSSNSPSFGHSPIQPVQHLSEQLPLNYEEPISDYVGDIIAESADCCLPVVSQSAFAIPSHNVIGIDTVHSARMLEFQNRQTNKELFILQHAAESGQVPSVVLGAQMRASMLFGSTNTANKFPYLGRFPTDFTGTTASDARILQANQAVTTHITPWAHGYFETLFSDVFSFSTFEQGSFQVRQAYVVLGDLNKSPFHAFIGKKNVTFGDFGTLNPFTQAVPWHYFGALAEGAGVGYTGHGLELSVTALDGGRGIRVADSEALGKLNNFAANGLYKFNIGPDSEIALGAGYLHGTIYDSAVPEHIDPTAFGPRNGAWDINANIRYKNFHLAGEFVQTLEVWPASNHKVLAYRMEAAADFNLGSYPSRISAGFSEGIQGADGTEFEFNNQFVAGMRVNASENAYVTAEWVRSAGFAPLINLTTVSDRDVVQNSLVLGLVLAL